MAQKYFNLAYLENVRGMSKVKVSRNKLYVLLLFSVIAYLAILYLFTPLYLIRYYGFSFESVVWVGSLTSLITFSFTWYVYVSLLINLNKLSRKYVIIGLLMLFIPVELFYVIPIFYGNIIVSVIRPLLPYTAYLLQFLMNIPSIQQFSIMWIFPMFLIPTMFYAYLRKVERPIIVKERKRARRS